MRQNRTDKQGSNRSPNMDQTSGDRSSSGSSSNERGVGSSDERMADPKQPDRKEPTDAGKTSGGGSSGHDQPDDVSAQTKIRNQSRGRDKTGGQRETPDPLPELEP